MSLMVAVVVWNLIIVVVAAAVAVVYVTKMYQIDVR
jgi:hypothetical protein